MTLHTVLIGCAQPDLDTARCTGCGLCAAACPCGAIEMHHGAPIFDCETACQGAASCPSVAHCLFPCEDVCPQGAIACAFSCEFSEAPRPPLGAPDADAQDRCP